MSGASTPSAPTGPRLIWRDLVMGMRFAVSGGRQGWARVLLTAVGVALGVTVLLLAASVPSILASQDDRANHRGGAFSGAASEVERSHRSVLTVDANTQYRGEQTYGRLLQAEGDSPARPPGVEQFPRPGEMVVSPELKRLLDSSEGAALRDRLDGKVIGTIADEGLLGPSELAFYKGADDLDGKPQTDRVEDYSGTITSGPMDPVLVLLVVVACAILVLPVAVFIATAARFGGERRDARLAALRLVGADVPMARRMAAGESLVGALLGLLLGGVLFLVARSLLSSVELMRISVFPVDVLPALPLTLLICVMVPVGAVLATQVAMRGVAIEPLGLVRHHGTRPRRMWWRLVPPVLGLLLLLPLAGTVTDSDASVNEVQVVSGVVLLLGGVSLLLPWLVERVVGRLRGGPLPWQLAVRRLQLSSGNASRAVSGITIAVAGAIALQMLFGAVEEHSTETRRVDKTEARVSGQGFSVDRAEKLRSDLRATDGIRRAQGYAAVYGEAKADEEYVQVVVADCATLRELAKLPNCRDGQAFLRGEPGEEGNAKPGQKLKLEESGPNGQAEKTWQVPASAERVAHRDSPAESEETGVLATPGALEPSTMAFLDKKFRFEGWVQTEDGTMAPLEELRTALFRADPSMSLFETRDETVSDDFVSISRALTVAAIGVLLLIGASMLVTTVEQLRDRRRELSVLVAFGTRRGTLGASVLWSTAIPVLLGMGLAVLFGLGLGWALLRLLSVRAGDWLVFLPVTAAGVGVIALVTALSMPFLWRVMRAEGLRTE
ncbi:FtsX-like permease family protein [Streptomyces sp. NPDC005438]|uniref:FtsX-like permease family protein n=1 Tax=Streptomyces sp. NPDC005438 TaxID=3156880 RepID=UPI0033A86D05